MGGRSSSSGMSGAGSANLSRIEDRIRGDSVETAALIGPNGEVIFDKSDGKADSVSFTDSECAMMVDATLTHNHPKGTTFSAEDINLATSRGLREIRAVHEGGFYSLTRDYNVGDQVPSYYAKFATQYNSAVNKYMRLSVDPVWSSTGDAIKCNAMVANYRRQWLKNNASNFGWTYKEG